MAGPLAGLLKDLEADCFASSEQRVLAAFVVTKCDPAPQGSRVRRALPKSTGKPRVICLTAKRRSRKRGFKGTLHVCKLAQGRYQVRKSVKLKLLTRIEAYVDSPGQQEYFELAFAQRGFTSGEARLAFEVKDAATRLELLGTLFAFCRAHEKRVPQVNGIEVSELEASAAQYTSKQNAEAAVGQTGRALLQEAAVREEGAGQDEGVDVHPLWGQREDKQIQSLLEMVSVGAASMEELQQRLEAELAALEDASVHEILENGELVGRVLGELGGTLRLLDDLEENLAVFDARLRHMREDIAAIEDRNNQLELHSRNNQKLLVALEGLVGRLALSEGAERALGARAITTASLPAMVHAAWELHTRLLALTPSPDGNSGASAPGAAAAGTPATVPAAGGRSSGSGGDENRLPASMANMAAVASQRQRLHGLQRAFLDKATEYLQQEFGSVADGPLQRLAAAGGSGSLRLRPADHGALRRRAAELAPLLEVVGVLRPAAAVAPREAYCQAVNNLLRREAHQAAGEVRRMAAAADAGGGHEPDLFARAAATDSAGALERLSTRPSRSPGSLGSSYRDAGIVPIHEGYEALLECLVPILAEEAHQLVALAFPKALPQPPQQQQGAAAVAGGSSAAAPGGGSAGRHAAGSEAATHAQTDPGSAEVQGALSALLAGVGTELLGLIDSVRPQRLLLCLPMLAVTLVWKQRLAARGAEARPLVALLAQCEQRLTAMLTAYFSERAPAIQRYDARSSMPSMSGTNVKYQHVLPFIANFPAVAGRIEELLERWPPEAQQAQQQQAQQAQQQQQQQQQSTPPAAGAARPAAPGASSGRPPLPPSAAGRPPLVPSPFQSSPSSRQTPGWRGLAESSASEVSSLPLSSETEEVSEISYMETEDEASSRRTTDASADAESGAAAGAARAAAAGTPPAAQQAAGAGRQGPAAPGPGDVLRELVDGGYEAWVRAIMAAVETAGATDAKHGTRLRLENYAFLQLGLQALPLDSTPVLAAFAGQAAAAKDRAMAGYIEQQVDYFKFTRVLEFSRKLDETMAAGGSAEVHLQLQFQPAEVRQLLSSTTTGLDKKLVQVYQRVQKHLGASSAYLVDQVWDKLEGICLERWGRMEGQLAACYQGMQLRPPPSELRRWFRAARQAAG
ncbi:exocyst complex component SEC3A [Chlorella sorokiniana]|uniref:Exocyst complex component SEC3A n=1 Tax=Chlorella sorokiniana TaxID=3076 RepID=A0A2P6TX98_CHLSO|nr:exocyst complex component SEC3A [Chlorella sorokiniana]|eukprot:PRW58682.1 exocyst complex component SEC3A [Chlorella sorokiniana]